MEVKLCYEGRNGSCLRTVYNFKIRFFLYLILVAVSGFTVVGNLLVIITVAHFKQLHTPTNYLIVSLAVADLLMGTVVMIPGMAKRVETCWYFGELFCKIFISALFVLSTASIVNLSFISIDRYYAVCQPMKYGRKITGNITLIMILLGWGFSVIVGFALVFLKLNILGIEDFYYAHVACEGRCIFFQSAVSSTVSSMLSFYIPVIIMLCIYLKIFLVAEKQARSIHNTKCPSSLKAPGKSQRKATKTLATIMGVFLFSWTPFFLCNLVDPFIRYSTPAILFQTLSWVGYLNSTVNPFVYAFFYSWFRRAFILIVSGKIFQSGSSEITLFAD